MPPRGAPTLTKYCILFHLFPSRNILFTPFPSCLLNKGWAGSLGGRGRPLGRGGRGSSRRGWLWAVAGAEEELPSGNDLLCRPARSAVGLVEVRLRLEHDERLGRVDAHVLRQAAGVQKLLPAGIAGVKDLRVGVCRGREKYTQKWGRRWAAGVGGASSVFPVSPASCTCFTALVISALSASVSSAVTAAATGTTAGRECAGTGT